MWFDGRGKIDIEYLREISGVPLSEEHVSKLAAISIAVGISVWPSEPINSALLKKLDTIEKSVNRILRAIDDGSEEAHFIKHQLIDSECLNGVRDLIEWASHYKWEFRDLVPKGKGTTQRYPGLNDFVSQCRRIWLDAGGEGLGSYTSNSSYTGYSGPFLALVKLLLETAGGKLPSDATIHRAIEEEAGHKKEK